MGCCASTFRRAPTSAGTASTTSRPWRWPSTAGRERPWAGEHRPKHWTRSSDQLIQAVLRRPLESTLDHLVVLPGDQVPVDWPRQHGLKARIGIGVAALGPVEALRLNALDPG